MKTKLPKLCRNKTRNAAFVYRDGKKIYLGKWGAPETGAAYRRYIAELTSERPTIGVGEFAAHSDDAPPRAVTVAELVAAFLDDRKDFYVKNGAQTKQLERFKTALAFLVQFFPGEPVNSVGPRKILFVRDEMEKSGRFCRTYINTLISCLRQVFKWGVARELVAASTLVGLQAVEPLPFRKSLAPEREPIEPVDAETVEKTLSFLPPIVAAMVRVQRLTGMRPGEVCAMRRGDVADSGDVWVYTLRTDKTEARRKVGRKKRVPLGSRVQAILTPYLAEKDGDPDAFLFSPADAARDRRIERRAARKSRVQPSQLARDAAPKTRKYADRYSADLYGKIVRKAAARAGVEIWSPNRLRHLYATEVRARFGVETAQTMLGHSKADTTEIYAEKDFARAVAVAAEIG